MPAPDADARRANAVALCQAARTHCEASAALLTETHLLMQLALERLEDGLEHRVAHTALMAFRPPRP